MIVLDESGDSLRAEHFVPEAVDRRAFQNIDLDSLAVRAASRFFVGSAPHAVVDNDVGRSTFAAEDQARQQALGAAGFMWGVRRVDREQCLSLVPQILIDDPKLRIGADLPLLLVGLAAYSPSVIWIARVRDTTIEDFTDIQSVMKDSALPSAVPIDGGLVPLSAARAGNTFLVQLGRNLPSRSAIGEILIDADNDGALHGIDFAQPGFGIAVAIECQRLAVPVGNAARHPAAIDLTFLSAPNIVAQIGQEYRIHRPFEADVKVGDFALLQSDQLDRVVFHALVDCGHALGITAQSI